MKTSGNSFKETQRRYIIVSRRIMQMLFKKSIEHTLTKNRK
jgi:hypothetical protein